jgi:hypothetical protein
MFQAIMSGDQTQLRKLGKGFASEKPFAALLCLDHVFQEIPRFQVSDSPQIAEVLTVFTTYIRLLRDTALNPDPCHDSAVQKLFGFRHLTENDFLLPTDTFLHRNMLKRGLRPLRWNDEGATISGRDLSRLFSDCLWERLRDRVLQEDDVCRRAKAFSPCLSYAASGYCNRPECPQMHVDVTSLQPQWFNMQVRIHLQQIVIFHSLHSVSLHPLDRFRRQWCVVNYVRLTSANIYIF